VAGAGYTANAVDAFGERGTFNYAFGLVITLPVLDLGRVRARVDEAEAYESEARAPTRERGEEARAYRGRRPAATARGARATGSGVNYQP
jgi:outer membrane protein TolC